MSDLKRTPLYEKHIEANAKMVPFAGYEMPVQYEGVLKEHMAVRERLGVFDVSHMGQFFVSGPKALDTLQKTTTNNVAKLAIGQAQYSCFTNEKGGIIDDLIIYKLSEEKYMLVVNAANIETDWSWINQQNEGAMLENKSEKMALLAIQGPKAIEAMQTLTSLVLDKIPFYHFRIGEFAGIPEAIVSATGYTGSGGLEIYIDAEKAPSLWDKVFEAGEKENIQACGLAARDTLRLEKGYCLHGNDINAEITPIEAGLGWITKFEKSFIGKEVLEDQKRNGTDRKLIAFKMKENGIPRKGYRLTDSQGQTVGEITSGSISPILQIGIGLAYVQTIFLKESIDLFVEIRGKQKKAERIKLPFI